MVTALLRTLFSFPNSESLLQRFHPSALLNSQLAGRYFEYYEKGAGLVIILCILGVVLFELFFSDWLQRFFAKILLLLTAFFWPIKSISFGESMALINVLRLPIISINPIFVYVCAVPFFALLLFSFSNRIKSLVSTPVYRLYICFILIASVILFLPILSGESV